MEPPTTSPTVPIDAQGLAALPAHHPSSKFEGRVFSELTGEDGGVPEKVDHASEEALSDLPNPSPQPIAPESVKVMQVGEDVDLDVFGDESDSPTPPDEERMENPPLPPPNPNPQETLRGPTENMMYPSNSFPTMPQHAGGKQSMHPVPENPLPASLLSQIKGRQLSEAIAGSVAEVSRQLLEKIREGTTLELAVAVEAASQVSATINENEQSLGVSQQEFCLNNNLVLSLINKDREERLWLKTPCSVEHRPAMTMDLRDQIVHHNSIPPEMKTLLLKLIDEGKLEFLDEHESKQVKDLAKNLSKELIRLYEHLVTEYLHKIEQIRTSKATHNLDIQSEKVAEKKQEARSNQVRDSVLTEELASEILLSSLVKQQRKTEEATANNRIEHDQAVQAKMKKRHQREKRLQHDENKFTQRQEEIQRESLKQQDRMK